MADGIKGFRARRKAAKVTDVAEQVEYPAEEKPTIAHRLQVWLAENPRTIRNAIIAVAGVTLIVLLFTVLRAAARDEHSRQLHTALEKYDQIKILPKGDVRSLQMKEFGLSLQSTCEQTLSTLQSSAVCFTAANALLEGKDFARAADYFGRAASGYDSVAMSSIAKFMQAQALEANRQFDKALAIYKDLETPFTEAKKAEMSIFHQGRMLYYLGRYDEAEERFVKLSRENKRKEYATKSRSYISLLSAERSSKK
jgi:tetratricopeptide (TPR) repeat protein